MNAHDDTTKYRARVQDRHGDRWSVVGTLAFLSRHAIEQQLALVSIKPNTPDLTGRL